MHGSLDGTRQTQSSPRPSCKTFWEPIDCMSRQLRPHVRKEPVLVYCEPDMAAKWLQQWPRFRHGVGGERNEDTIRGKSSALSYSNNRANIGSQGGCGVKVALSTRTPLETPVEQPDDLAFACRMKMRDDYEVWIRRSFNMLRGCSRSCTSIIGFFDKIRTERSAICAPKVSPGITACIALSIS